MIATLVTISLLHWVVLVTPGVNFALLLQISASGRRRSALAAAIGITCATFVWATLAVLGVGAVFAAHPALRQLIQCAGGIYLCWVACKLWRSPSRATEIDKLEIVPKAAFVRGFATNILNPKPAVFFGSIFVTIFPPNPSPTLIVLTVIVVVCNALVWHAFLALVFSNRRVQQGYDRIRRPINRVAAVVIAGFGGRLLVSTFAEFRR